MWIRNSSDAAEMSTSLESNNTLNQTTALIKQSVGDKKEDEMFYEILIEQAPTDKEKDIIKRVD